LEELMLTAGNASAGDSHRDIVDGDSQCDRAARARLAARVRGAKADLGFVIRVTVGVQENGTDYVPYMTC
jgi:hypothetical protein